MQKKSQSAQRGRSAEHADEEHGLGVAEQETK
jgi:hypothetical protein